ncbi:MAG: polymer-forming cytoskeletal protein [Arenicellales bacterium]
MWPNRPVAFEAANADLLTSGANFGETGDGIARGIRIVGDIKGTHDLSIAGSVIGSVFLPRNQVLVRSGAQVVANVTARVIEVEGTVTGDLKAAERVVIRSSSTVEGNIVSPQIQLEEGCMFKGSVQMHEPDVKTQPPSKPRVVGEPGAVRIKMVAG